MIRITKSPVVLLGMITEEIVTEMTPVWANNYRDAEKRKLVAGIGCVAIVLIEL